jgi:hypothetical protein
MISVTSIYFLPKPFSDNHIFQPSKFYQGVFDTLNKKNVEIEDNHIITKSGTKIVIFDIFTFSGFKVIRKVKILFEELFYNKEYKPFRVLCIDSIQFQNPIMIIIFKVCLKEDLIYPTKNLSQVYNFHYR